MINREDGSRTEFYPSMDRFRQARRNEKGAKWIEENILIIQFILSRFHSD